MMLIENGILDQYKSEYETDIGNRIRKNYKIKKKDILKCEEINFLKETAGFIDVNGQLNLEQIKIFLTTPVWELEESDWVQEYITLVRFCNEFPLFRQYYEWKHEQTFSKGKIELRRIRQEYMQNSKCDKIISDYQLDKKRMLASQKEFDKAVKVVRTDLHRKNDAIKLLFSYEMMSEEIKNAIKKLYNVEVCPYCNRQFVSWWEGKSGFHATSDLDHVLPKAIFPLFALNIYNIVPVCLVCNRYIKLNRYMPIWNPFKEGFDSMTRFIINKYENAEAYIGLNTDFQIKLQSDNDLESSQADIVNRTIWFFKFNELYNNHKEYVKTLIRKKYIYTPEVIKELNQLLGAKRLSQKEIELLLYGVIKDDENYNNKILGKLTYDILWMH